MYTEEYEKRGFPIKKVLGFLCISVLLVIGFLLGKRYYKKLQNEKKSKEEIIMMKKKLTRNEESLEEGKKVSQVFIDNIQYLKKVALSYYKKEHLPKSFGDTSKLTLNDMLQLKLLVPLVDQHQQEYDREETFVQVTNLGEEYLMRVYLKGKNEENYIWVTIGDYDYCKEFDYKT